MKMLIEPYIKTMFSFFPSCVAIKGLNVYAKAFTNDHGPLKIEQILYRHLVFSISSELNSHFIFDIYSSAI